MVLLIILVKCKTFDILFYVIFIVCGLRMCHVCLMMSVYLINSYLTLLFQQTAV